jgi:D-methionine transport system substrate-binding protein
MKKNKFLVIAIVLALALLAFTACGSKDADTPAPPADSAAATDDSAATDDAVAEEPAAEPVTLTIGASPTPHAEILAQVVDTLAEQGITLTIQEFTDYVLPNTALNDGELQANYFQHQPYLDQFNAENGTNIVPAGSIHYEPLGIYPGKTARLEDLKDGATVAIPNDGSNEARALLLLQDKGLITLKDGAGFEATVKDIADNPKNLKIKEIAAEQLSRSLQDVDVAVINGNYAIDAGLNAATDALAKEEVDSVSATTYANIIAVNAGDETKPEIQALVAALQSDAIRQFIEEKYQGAVVPTF